MTKEKCNCLARDDEVCIICHPERFCAKCKVPPQYCNCKMEKKLIDWNKTDFVTIVSVAGWVAFCIILIMALIYLRFYH